MRWVLTSTLGLLLLLNPALGSAQAVTDPVTDAYLDPGAATLHRAAATTWREIDESIVRYTAKVQQRIAVSIRAPLKDRILYRNESAVRVFWDRDYDNFIQVLGAHSQYPGKGLEEQRSFLDDLTIDEAFDPGGDRLIFGFGTAEDSEDQQAEEEEFWVAHPLAPGADSLYQFQSGDTLVISIADRPDLRIIELQVLPRIADVHRITGSLWIVPETGALVRAIYRLSQQFDAIRDIQELQEEEENGEFKYVPGFLKPWTFDLEMVAIDYSFWNMEVWLPRSMRIEGQVAAGILKFPVSMDLAYQIESVVTESDLGTPEYDSEILEERHFRTRSEAMAFLSSLMTDEDGVTYEPFGRNDGGRRAGRRNTSTLLVPEDPTILETSPHLPPPIWEDAPGFASAQQIEEMFKSLENLPTPPLAHVPWAANWGWNRPDLIRYNRVEGPAVGGKLEKEFGSFLGPISLEAKGFFGFADLEPKVSLSLERQTLRRRWTLGLYRDIRMVDPRGRHLNFGNSLNAFLFGRDDGEYFLASGADLVLTPRETRRQSWEVRAYAERHDAMLTETSFTLAHPFFGDWTFRDNVDARNIEEVGGEVKVSPWWGTDPLLPQFGLELYAQGAAWREVDSAETGNYTRARAIFRSALPLKEGLWRIGIEAGGGTSWGDPPVQRGWFMGGARTLRGYRAASLTGETFGRGRLEIGRVFPVGTATVFGDGAWAGERGLFESGDILYSVGIGGSVLDGLVRMDISQGLRGPFKRTRLDLYVDAIF